MIGGSKPRKELIGYMDIWDPITHGGDIYDFDPQSTKAALERGEEVFWYTCVGPKMPFANVYNDHPLTAIRALWWQSWKYGITGYEYWWFNWWESNLELSKGSRPWPLDRRREWNSRSYDWANGDGLLVYPGPEGTALPSLRLSVIRDAIEDWEVLFLLDRASECAGRSPETEQLVQQASKILSVPRFVTADLTHWSKDPRVYFNIRAETYRVLGEITAAVGRDRLEEHRRDWIDKHRKWLSQKLEDRVAALPAAPSE
jgi:hypothetical protein